MHAASHVVQAAPHVVHAPTRVVQAADVARSLDASHDADRALPRPGQYPQLAGGNGGAPARTASQAFVSVWYETWLTASPA